MTKTIKIDFISDVICPWCVIGYTRLERAIKELDLQDQIDINWQPFFLNPDMPLEGENMNDYGARKYERTLKESDSNKAKITNLGKKIGFSFNFDENSRIANTRDAHTLLDYAKGSGMQTKLKKRLFEAHFTEQKNISDREILEDELNRVGLEVNQLNKVLDNKETQNRISAEFSDWKKLGVTVVPTMIFNDELVVNGGRSVEAYKEILAKIIAQ